EPLAALADDLVAGRMRDEVREAFHRDRVAVPDIGLDGGGKRYELRHGRHLGEGSGRVLRGGQFAVKSAMEDTSSGPRTLRQRTPPVSRTTDDTDVLISEVGPRDGLQSLKRAMPTEAKNRWIAALARAGLREIEVGSFVSPRALPQMADCAEVVRHALTIPGLRVAVLV